MPCVRTCGIQILGTKLCQELLLQQYALTNNYLVIVLHCSQGRYCPLGAAAYCCTAVLLRDTEYLIVPGIGYRSIARNIEASSTSVKEGILHCCCCIRVCVCVYSRNYSVQLSVDTSGCTSRGHTEEKRENPPYILLYHDTKEHFSLHPPFAALFQFLSRE